MKYIEKNGRTISVLERGHLIQTPNDALDLMAEAQYYGGSDGLVIFHENLGEPFFDLKTRFAGEILQKFVTYNVRVAIVGDYKGFQSKALQAFVRECNRGRHISWVLDLEDAFRVLATA